MWIVHKTKDLIAMENCAAQQEPSLDLDKHNNYQDRVGKALMLRSRRNPRELLL